VRVGPRGFALFVVDPLALGLPANPNRIDYLDYCAIPKGVDPGASNVQCAIGTGGTPTSGFSGPPDPGFWR
jgi:hypothetical protein